MYKYISLNTTVDTLILASQSGFETKCLHDLTLTTILAILTTINAPLTSVHNNQGTYARTLIKHTSNHTNAYYKVRYSNCGLHMKTYEFSDGKLYATQIWEVLRLILILS